MLSTEIHLYSTVYRDYFIVVQLPRGGLPFDCNAEPYYLLVPHYIIPEDETESEHYFIQGITQGTEKNVFRDEDVHVLFKARFDNGLNLYCSEKFKKSVEKYDLTGIYFDTNLARAVR